MNPAVSKKTQDFLEKGIETTPLHSFFKHNSSIHARKLLIRWTGFETHANVSNHASDGITPTKFDIDWFVITAAAKLAMISGYSPNRTKYIPGLFLWSLLETLPHLSETFENRWGDSKFECSTWTAYRSKVISGDAVYENMWVLVLNLTVKSINERSYSTKPLVLAWSDDETRIVVTTPTSATYGKNQCFVIMPSRLRQGFVKPNVSTGKKIHSMAQLPTPLQNMLKTLRWIPGIVRLDDTSRATPATVSVPPSKTPNKTDPHIKPSTISIEIDYKVLSWSSVLGIENRVWSEPQHYTRALFPGLSSYFQFYNIPDGIAGLHNNLLIVRHPNPANKTNPSISLTHTKALPIKTPWFLNVNNVYRLDGTDEDNSAMTISKRVLVKNARLFEKTIAHIGQGMVGALDRGELFNFLSLFRNSNPLHIRRSIDPSFPWSEGGVSGTQVNRDVNVNNNSFSNLVRVSALDCENTFTASVRMPTTYKQTRRKRGASRKERKMEAKLVRQTQPEKSTDIFSPSFRSYTRFQSKRATWATDKNLREHKNPPAKQRYTERVASALSNYFAGGVCKGTLENKTLARDYLFLLKTCKNEVGPCVAPNSVLTSFSIYTGSCPIPMAVLRTKKSLFEGELEELKKKAVLAEQDVNDLIEELMWEETQQLDKKRGGELHVLCHDPFLRSWPLRNSKSGQAVITSDIPLKGYVACPIHPGQAPLNLTWGRGGANRRLAGKLLRNTKLFSSGVNPDEYLVWQM